MTGLLDLTVRPPIWVGPDSGVYHHDRYLSWHDGVMPSELAFSSQ